MVKIKKLPKIKSNTIKQLSADELEEFWDDCTKCGCTETMYFHTDFYAARRKYSTEWDNNIVLCLRCAREEGWAW